MSRVPKPQISTKAVAVGERQGESRGIDAFWTRYDRANGPLGSLLCCHMMIAGFERTGRTPNIFPLAAFVLLAIRVSPLRAWRTEAVLVSASLHPRRASIRERLHPLIISLFAHSQFVGRGPVARARG